MSDKKFSGKVREWLERHCPDVQEGRVRQSASRHPYLWYTSQAPERLRQRDNADRYVAKDGYADRWVGPDV